MKQQLVALAFVFGLVLALIAYISGAFAQQPAPPTVEQYENQALVNMRDIGELQVRLANALMALKQAQQKVAECSNTTPKVQPEKK